MTVTQATGNWQQATGQGAASQGTSRDDAVLLAGLRGGDHAAFETIIHRHAPRMLAVARRMLGNDDDANDVLQDAFISAFKACATFEGGSQISTWLHRIVVN